MKIEMPLTLDVVTERSPFDYTSVKRGDNESRVLVVSLTCMGKNFEIPEDASIELRCKKPDGTATLTDGNIVDNKIYIELTQNTLAVPGDALCELKLTKDTEVLTTVNFILRILENALSDDEIISTNDFTSIKTEFLKSFVVDDKMYDSSENPVQNKVIKEYVDDTEIRIVEKISNTENFLVMQIDTIDVNGEKLKNKGVPNGYAPLDENAQIPDEHISNLSDRILNVETNKADISYVDNAISSAINEALEGDY